MGNGGREVQRPTEPLVQGTKPNPAPFGNAKALDVGRGGPGTGRTVYASGSQGTHRPEAQGGPQPAPRDILSEFSPQGRR